MVDEDDNDGPEVDEHAEGNRAPEDEYVEERDTVMSLQRNKKARLEKTSTTSTTSEILTYLKYRHQERKCSEMNNNELFFCSMGKLLSKCHLICRLK